MRKKGFLLNQKSCFTLSCSGIVKDHLSHFPASARKKKKKTIRLEKKFLYFRKRSFLARNIKKILIFCQKEAFLIFAGIKKFLTYPETQLWSSNIKKIWYFLKERFSYIFSNETLHFSLQARKIKENNPENNFLHFRKRKQRKNVLHFLKRNIL